MKFDKILELINEKERKLSELKEKHDNLMLELANSTEQLEKGGTSSYEDFKKKKDEIEETKSKITWLETQITAVKEEERVTKADILSSWNSMAAVYNEAFDRKLKEYQTAKGELFKLYANLVREQNEMLHKRRAYGKLLGIVTNDYFDEPVLGHMTFKGLPNLDITVGCNYKGNRYSAMEIPLFLHYGYLTDVEAAKYNKIVGLRTATTLQEDEKEPGT